MLENLLTRRNMPSGRPWTSQRDFVRLDGSINQSKRQASIDAFNTTKSLKLFLISTKVLAPEDSILRRLISCTICRLVVWASI
jgi:SNF2 family DNA or RNA helicase